MKYEGNELSPNEEYVVYLLLLLVGFILGVAVTLVSIFLLFGR